MLPVVRLSAFLLFIMLLSTGFQSAYSHNCMQHAVDAFFQATTNNVAYLLPGDASQSRKEEWLKKNKGIDFFTLDTGQCVVVLQDNLLLYSPLKLCHHILLRKPALPDLDPLKGNVWLQQQQKPETTNMLTYILDTSHLKKATGKKTYRRVQPNNDFKGEALIIFQTETCDRLDSTLPEYLAKGGVLGIKPLGTSETLQGIQFECTQSKQTGDKRPFDFLVHNIEQDKEKERTQKIEEQYKKIADEIKRQQLLEARRSKKNMNSKSKQKSAATVEEESAALEIQNLGKSLKSKLAKSVLSKLREDCRKISVKSQHNSDNHTLNSDNHVLKDNITTLKKYNRTEWMKIQKIVKKTPKLAPYAAQYGL